MAATAPARHTRVALVVVTPAAATRVAVPLAQEVIRAVRPPVAHPAVVAPLPVANHFALITNH